MSVLKKSQYLSLTPNDMNLSTSYKGLSTKIVKHGKILHKNLKQNNLTQDWLTKELKKRNIFNISDVIYAALNTSGVLYVRISQSNHSYIQKVED